MNTFRKTVQAHSRRLAFSGILVAIFAIGGFFAIHGSHAATYATSAEAESGTLSGNAASVSDSSASGGSAVKFGPADTGGGGGSCDLPKYPTTACTGVPAGTQLTTINGDYTVTADNTVIDGKLITGALNVYASNVTIKNSEIRGGINNQEYVGNGYTYHGPFTVTDTTIGPTSGCNGDAAIKFANYTATRVYVHNFSDGPRIGGAAAGITNGSGVPGTVTIQDSLIQVCGVSSDDHSDGVQAYNGGVGGRVIHNTIDERGAQFKNSGLLASDSPGVTAQDNLFVDGGFIIHLDGTTKSTFTGNKVVNDIWQYGPIYPGLCSEVTWTNNSLVTIDSGYNVTSTVGALSCS